jgi:hypothetical protein
MLALIAYFVLFMFVALVPRQPPKGACTQAKELSGSRCQAGRNRSRMCGTAGARLGAHTSCMPPPPTKHTCLDTRPQHHTHHFFILPNLLSSSTTLSIPAQITIHSTELHNGYRHLHRPRPGSLDCRLLLLLRHLARDQAQDGAASSQDHGREQDVLHGQG